MSNLKIPFNKPFLSGNELKYIQQAVESGKISGDGVFTKKCHAFFQKSYGFRKVLLTTSCTDALEMAAILIDTKPGDEIIMPSYTFVSTANAFVLRGATIVFSDSKKSNPNLNVDLIEPLINEKTKAIVLVHYAGIACNMDKVMKLAEKYKLFVIEDAAQGISSFYKSKPLGTIGHFAAFSFHETKNIICGEGGMLVINDPVFDERAEIIREKGTNRSKFFRGEVDKYGWVDVGSSFLPSELTAAYLFAQLEKLDKIQEKRLKIWNTYYSILEGIYEKYGIQLPVIEEYATNNAHLFYLVCRNIKQRSGMIEYLKQQGIMAVFHYQSLHKSSYYISKHDGRELPESDRYSDCLLRLPLYYELEIADAEKIAELVLKYLELYH
jgi:dTDP-4-amino-4,6-dideoxygalactose transaminase